LFPAFLEQEWGDSSAVLGCDDVPERVTVSFVYAAETILVDAGDVHRSGVDAAVEAKGLGGSGVWDGATRERWFGEDGNWVAESTDRAVGSWSRKKAGSRRKLHVFRWWRVIIAWWCLGKNGGLVNRRWNRDRKDWWFGSGAGARRCHRVGTLAAVAAMWQLVKV
jgi:hypothetical protein